MAVERIAKRYALALIELCSQDMEKARHYESSLKAIEAIFENHDIKVVLTSPVVGSELKRAVLKDISEQLEADKVLSCFLDHVAEANRVSIIPAIGRALKKLINESQGVVEATVTTVFELDTDSLKDIQDKLEFQIGKKVELNNEVDKSVLGGVVIRVENSVLDMSLKTKLESLTRSAVL